MRKAKTEVEGETRSRSWLKISCVGCVGLPCICLMFTFAFMKCQLKRVGDTLEPELAKLRKMGIPTEPEDLVRKPTVPDKDNAAPLYVQIQALQQKVAKDHPDDEKYLTQFALDPADVAKYREALKRAEPQLQLIEQLKNRPHCDFKNDFSNPDLWPYNESSGSRLAAKMLTCRIRYLMATGQATLALPDIDTQLAIAGHMSEGPIGSDTLAGVSIVSMALTNFKFYLQTILDNPQQLAEAEEILLRRQLNPSIQQALLSELVTGRIQIRNIKSWSEIYFMSHGPDEPDSFQKALDRATINDPAFLRMYEAKYVQLWREFFESAPKDPRDYKGYIKAMDELELKLEKDNSIENQVNLLMSPVYQNLGESLIREQAQQRTALLAVKLLRRRASGLPPNLKEFGDLAQDPITGKSMGYVVKGRNFKIWNAGQNKVDDGGRLHVTGSGLPTRDSDDGYSFGLDPVRFYIAPVNYLQTRSYKFIDPTTYRLPSGGSPGRPPASSTPRTPPPSYR